MLLRFRRHRMLARFVARTYDFASSVDLSVRNQIDGPAMPRSERTHYSGVWHDLRDLGRP